MPPCLGHPAILAELHQLKRDKGVASKVRKGGAEAILKRSHFRARCNPFRILLLLFHFVPFLCGAAVCSLPLQESASFPLTQPRIGNFRGWLSTSYCCQCLQCLQSAWGTPSMSSTNSPNDIHWNPKCHHWQWDQRCFWRCHRNSWGWGKATEVDVSKMFLLTSTSVSFYLSLRYCDDTVVFEPQITKSFGHRKAWVVSAFEHAMGHLGHSIKMDLSSSLSFVVLRFAVFRCKNQLPFLWPNHASAVAHGSLLKGNSMLLKGNKIWTAHLDDYRCEAHAKHLWE